MASHTPTSVLLTLKRVQMVKRMNLRMTLWMSIHWWLECPIRPFILGNETLFFIYQIQMNLAFLNHPQEHPASAGKVTHMIARIYHC